jgi:hypothetical protein
MNLKTTFFLILLLGAGVGGWYWLEQQEVKEAASPTLDFLKSLPKKKSEIQRVVVMRDKDTHFTLERTGMDWSLPGKWPARTQESEQWINDLVHLQSRFAPAPIATGTDLIAVGLDPAALTVRIEMGDTTHTLRFGEEPSETNRFTRSTYMRLNDEKEYVRLGPGVLAALDRTPEFFKQRRLFPTERVARDEDSKDKVEQLAAAKVDVESATEKYSLVKSGQDWIVKDAFKKEGADWKPLFSEDRIEPGKIKTMLAAYPDLWADRFVEKKGKALSDFGLAEPEFKLTVTRPAGAKSTLLLGKVSDKKVRMIGKMPQQNPFGPPPKPPQMVTEEYRFAKLESNDQIFEIKSEKFADVMIPLESLRDPLVARFKTDDVKRLEIQHGDSHLAFVKIKENDKEKWRFEKPSKDEAETKQIADLLEKLSGLQASEKEILDNADPKTVGLAKPSATIKLELEEGEKDKKKKRELVFQVGQKDKEKDKLYVRVDGWPRVNQVNDELLKLVARPALAYRNRRVLDLAAADLNRIEIARAGEKYAFEKVGADWKLAIPVKSDIDSARVASLADDLAKIEGIELVSDAPKEEDLTKVYGFAKAKLTATLHAKDSKTPKTLMLGNARDGKQEYYARIDNGPVFTVKKELRDDLDKSSLSYRPLQLWQMDPDTITEVTIRKDESSYALKRADKTWKISGPFDADAQPIEAEDLVESLAKMRAERFESHQEKDLGKFGLGKPAHRITIGGKEKRVLDIGSRLSPTDASRFAKLSDSDAVFVLDEKTLALLKRDAVDFLDKSLLSVNVGDIQRIRYQGAKFALESKGEQWLVVDAPAPAFAANEEAVEQAMLPWRNLRADKFIAYGSKIDWSKYGLDKPAATVTVTMKADPKDKKAAEHTLTLGNESDGGRYARLDKKDAVVLLDARTVEALKRTHLDFLDTRVLKFDLDAVTAIRRQMTNNDVELTKREDNWQLTKPATRDADNLTVGDVLEKTFRLKAKRIAAHPATDLKPFGLEKPYAVVTLQTEGGKHIIKVGDLARDVGRKDTEERYAMIDDSKSVVVLSAELSRHLVAPPLYFADRNLASFSGVDTAILKRGEREATFTKSDVWKMTVPVKADAEDANMEELVRLLQRLRADEIVAEKGADLKKFGLDQPVVQWRFKSGDAEKVHLLVGSLENDKPGARRYAKLGNQDQVFLLSAKLTAKATEEFRDRKPWPALDAAQVEELTVTSADKKFTLRKKDGKWSVPGEDWTVKTDIVIDTLDALASLKALRYVADTKANPQLYGLAKPAWKIELQTPMGKRELWLGGNEGGASKRFYAAVPGSDSVFVIDDDQSARIARPLSAYLETEKKK